MKNLVKLTFVCIAMAVLYSGCKKNADSPSSSGSFMYDGKSYPLSIGVLENYGTSGGVYGLDLTLLSSGFKIVEANDQIESLSGSGHAVQFSLVTTTGSKLDVGTYIFNESGNVAGTLYDGGARVNYSTETGAGTQLVITAGSLTVTKNSSEYELSFDCNTEDNKNIKGTFKGTLKYYSYVANNANASFSAKLNSKATFLKKK